MNVLDFTVKAQDGTDVALADVEAKLSGITCGNRSTSCGDQLSKAVREAYEAELRGDVQTIDEQNRLNRTDDQNLDSYYNALIGFCYGR